MANAITCKSVWTLKPLTLIFITVKRSVPFILSPNTAALSYKLSASATISRDTCRAREDDKKERPVYKMTLEKKNKYATSAKVNIFVVRNRHVSRAKYSLASVFIAIGNETLSCMGEIWCVNSSKLTSVLLVKNLLKLVTENTPVVVTNIQRVKLSLSVP